MYPWCHSIVALCRQTYFVSFKTTKVVLLHSCLTRSAYEDVKVSMSAKQVPERVKLSISHVDTLVSR